MTGKAEIARQRQRLDTAFARAGSLGADAELLSDFARYLCVLVSGFLEQAVVEMLSEYVRRHSDMRVQQHVEQRMRLLTNLKAQRLIEIFGNFDLKWRIELENFLVDEYKDALNGIVDLRNAIAHGRNVGVTMIRVQDYYGRIKCVIEYLTRLCALG
jgi:proline dehydrogenase